MRYLLRSTILTVSVLVACWGNPGCSTNTPSDPGKMTGPMDKMDTGTMATKKP